MSTQYADVITTSTIVTKQHLRCSLAARHMLSVLSRSDAQATSSNETPARPLLCRPTVQLPLASRDALDWRLSLDAFDWFTSREQLQIRWWQLAS